ncbi:CU044_2847 family protein [Flindersiella endophytica]
MVQERPIKLDLEDGTFLLVVAEQVGPVQVADKGVVAKLGSVVAPIETLSRNVLDAMKRVGPSKATVELSFGLAIEQGQLLALFGQGKGEASIKVTLEWAKPSAESG